MTRILYPISIILLSFAFTTSAGKAQESTAGNTPASPLSLSSSLNESSRFLYQRKPALKSKVNLPTMPL